MFKDKTYSILKFVALTVIPGLITFLGVILTTIDLPNTDAIMTISTAFATLVGTLVVASKHVYDKDNEIDVDSLDFMQNEELSDNKGEV